MNKLFDVDWQSVFVPTESLLEIFIRGTIIMSRIRPQGIENINEIKQACLESDGHFSFIKKEDDEVQSNETKKNVVN